MWHKPFRGGGSMLSSVSWTTRAMQCHLPSSRTGAASLASGSSSSSLDKLKKKTGSSYSRFSAHYCLVTFHYSLFYAALTIVVGVICTCDSYSTPPEREGSLSLGFLLFLCVGFFRSRCWIWTECRALWTQATQMGLFIDWLKMLQQKWRLIRPYSLVHYCPPLACTVLESLGVSAHMGAPGVFCTPRSQPVLTWLTIVFLSPFSSDLCHHPAILAQRTATY